MLNIVQENTGSYDPYIKWNGKAGRFFIRENDDDKEVTPDRFILDLESIKTGWMHFAAGMAPDRVWDVSLSQPAARPTENHKRGFLVKVYSKNLGGKFELSGNSMHLCAAMNDLYSAFEAEKSSNVGKVPVIKYDGSTAMKDKHGTNYKPKFVLEKWVDRPAELDATPAQASAPATQAQAAPAASVNEF